VNGGAVGFVVVAGRVVVAVVAGADGAAGGVGVEQEAVHARISAAAKAAPDLPISPI
jgi:hypothetical protein